MEKKNSNGCFPGFSRDFVLEGIHVTSLEVNHSSPLPPMMGLEDEPFLLGPGNGLQGVM